MNREVLTNAKIDFSIKFWLDRLNLGRWKVDWKVIELLNKKNLLEIRPTRSRNKATIFIAPTTLNLTVEEFELLIVHELVHLLLDPMAEEHSFQLEFSVDKLKQSECRTRFVRVLEKSVEQTAELLYCAFKP